MMNHECCLVMDAWIREAQEATKLVEDIESRIKNKDLAEENRLRDIAQSKLIEAGVKLDRLESLLHNPPSKPALAGSFLASTTTGTSRTTNSLDQALDSFITKLGHPKRYSKYSGISDQIYEERVGMVRSALYPIIRSIMPPSYIVLSGFVALASDPKPRYGRSEKEVALQIRSRAAHAAYFRGYNPRSSAVQGFWFLCFNKFNQEGVLDLLFDSWSSCTAICLGYNLRSNIIYILCLFVCYYSFLFTTSELQAFSFYQKSPNISFM
ncbi:hypothetical protein NC651_029930 [Populus alba x Populus x berolinensis]|nr:hypothetical protein NC651_029930 [Populus alba x Populus x berolinensis]